MKGLREWLHLEAGVVIRWMGQTQRAPKLLYVSTSNKRDMGRNESEMIWKVWMDRNEQLNDSVRWRKMVVGISTRQEMKAKINMWEIRCAHTCTKSGTACECRCRRRFWGEVLSSCTRAMKRSWAERERETELWTQFTTIRLLLVSDWQRTRRLES